MDNTVEVQELGKVMITPKGEYSSSKSYEILDAVSYNGSSYVSKINDNTSVLTSNDWQLLAQKGDVYDVTEEDLQAIAKQITDNANSAFNQNVKAKTREFNTNATNKLNDYDTNVKSTTETFDANAKKKLDEYNANDTKKLKAYNDNADNKLSAYNTNDTIKFKAYNTNADSKIEEYNTNANSKILEYDKHSEELRNMAISTDNKLERVKNEILDTGSASDSFIYVEDSCMAKIKELEIEGVLQQNTTTGKNLLPNNATSQTINGINYTVNSDGSVYAKGTATARSEFNIHNKPFTLNANTEYKFQSDILMVISTTTGYISGKKGQTFTSESEISALSVYIRVENGTSIDKKIYPMITLVGANSTYEPYTGGQPSPNPDYPQEIKTITDSLKITSCGKNLFDINKFKEKITGQGIASSIDGSSIICNGTAITTYATVALPKLSNVKLYPGEYMISVRNTLPYSFAFQTARQDGTRGPDIILHTNRKSENFKVNELLTIVSAFLSFMTERPTLTNFTISDIQIEQANTASEYEPYVESQIQAKLPEGEFIGKIDDTHKDTSRAEYFPEEGQYHWMLDKMVGKYTFTGNENWSTYTQSNGIPIFRCTLPASGYVVKSNYFVSQTTWPTLLEENRIFNHVGNYQNIEIACSKFDTLTNFKNFLTTNVVQMYYGLKTPYTLDLGPIAMPLSYKRITNIFTDSDLLPKITAKYYRTFEKTILNMQINEKSLKQEITDLNNNISDITKRIEALESANVSTVEESEASNDLQN